MTCRAPHGCSREPGKVYQNPDFAMEIGGDTFECRHGSAGMNLVIRNSQDPTDRIALTIEGYTGAGHYALDRVLARSINFVTTTRTENCRSGVPEGTFGTGTAQAGSPDTCGAQGCTVDVTDPSPGAPYPKPLRFDVSCPNVCPNGSTYMCTAPTGPIRFSVQPTCEG